MEHRGRRRTAALTAGRKTLLLLLFVGLMGVVLWTRTVGREGRGGFSPWPAGSPGQTVSRQDLAAEPLRPLAVGAPERLKRSLQTGATYLTVLKGGVMCPAGAGCPDLTRGRYLVYVFEMQTRRTIESNDGFRIVEVRHFEHLRMAKLVAAMAPPNLDLGEPGRLPLEPLEHLMPDAGSVEADVGVVGEVVLGTRGGAAGEPGQGKAYLRVGTLAGKKVRISYRDGLGVESIQPIACTLTAKEVEYLFNTPVAADCHFLAFAETRPGRRPTLDAGALAMFLDPSLPVIVRGKVRIEEAGNGRGWKIWQPEDDSPTLRSAGPARRFVGSVSLAGIMQADPEGRFVEAADLSGLLHLCLTPRDSLFFEEVVAAAPEFHAHYQCTYYSTRE